MSQRKLGNIDTETVNGLLSKVEHFTGGVFKSRSAVYVVFFCFFSTDL